MNRALIPPPASEREALRRECEADLRVWVAASGAALPAPFPNPRNHAEEIANVRAAAEA
jgi:hypothetical protein